MDIERQFLKETPLGLPCLPLSTVQRLIPIFADPTQLKATLVQVFDNRNGELLGHLGPTLKLETHPDPDYVPDHQSPQHTGTFEITYEAPNAPPEHKVTLMGGLYQMPEGQIVSFYPPKGADEKNRDFMTAASLRIIAGAFEPKP